MLLNDLKIVIKVAELLSISAAAVNMDMRAGTASAALKRVESTLGVKLFIRTTRQLRLSSAGEKYIPQCKQALLMLDIAKQNIKSDLDIVDGELRISLSSDLGRNLVIPWLDEFIEIHPNVSLSTNISDTIINFYRDAVDLALRYGSPTDANIYGFKICNAPRLLCATPAYLKKNGTPKHPDDLRTHQGLFYQLSNSIHDVWEFSHGSQEYKIKMSGNRSSNDGDLVRRWCITDKGVAIKSCLDMSNDLLSGKVVNLMPDYRPTPSELWLLFPSRDLITPAARLLRDHFVQKSHEILNRLTKKGII